MVFCTFCMWHELQVVPASTSCISINKIPTYRWISSLKDVPGRLAGMWVFLVDTLSFYNCLQVWPISFWRHRQTCRVMWAIHDDSWLWRLIINNFLPFVFPWSAIVSTSPARYGRACTCLMLQVDQPYKLLHKLIKPFFGLILFVWQLVWLPNQRAAHVHNFSER